MKLKRFLLFLCIPVIFQGCSVFRAVAIIRGGEPVAGQVLESRIPFELIGHIIVVKAKINQSAQDYLMIVDTGAMTVINAEMTNELGIVKEMEINGSGTGGEKTQTMGLGVIRNLSIGQVTVSNCGAALYDFRSRDSFFREFSRKNILGIIGSNILRNFKVTFDYHDRIMILSLESNSAVNISNSISVPLTQNMSLGFAPEIEVRVNHQSFKGVVDTGATGLIFSKIGLEKLIRAGDVRTVETEGVMGGGAFSSTSNGVIIGLDSFEIGPMRLTNLSAFAMDQNDAFRDKILIGKSFLDNYLVTINYPASEMTFVPMTGTSVKYRTYGFSVKRNDADRFIVSGLVNGSPAKKNGLSIGDEILELNSISVTNSSLLDIFALLNDPEKSDLNLKVERDGAVLKFRLEKMEL